MVIGFALPAAACWFGDRVPGGQSTKALFTIAAAGVVALIVRSQGWSWAHDANLAFRRWILGLAALVFAGSTLAALAPTYWAKERPRPSTSR